MFLEKIKSEGLAHLSYIVGDGGKATVIDPRRDCSIYRVIADREGCRITEIFETHRNEDYVIGSVELARRTGAAIRHGAALPFAYGEAVTEGDEFPLGDLTLKVLTTPGHTDESISIVLYERGAGDSPVAVFSGDALFIGDTGRTDFFPDRREEVAGLLYDSIFNKLLPLGDQTILYPAHGSGSVCGSTLSAREFSTLGLERRHNPGLQVKNRDEFVARKAGEFHYLPPYFQRMEFLNLEGTPPGSLIPRPAPAAAAEFAGEAEEGMIVLDLRSPEAVSGAFLPGSLAIPLEMLSDFAGWFLPYDRPIGLVVEEGRTAREAARYLFRIGYEDIPFFLAGGLLQWETSGRRYDRIPSIHAAEIVEKIASRDDFTLLDVRSREEFESGHLPGAIHIYLGELPGHLKEIPDPRPLVTFCGSGLRAIIAASLLKRNGLEEVEVCLGSMEACSEIGCPIRTGEE
jgi:hydroxyacylglutathione hydrolase